MIEDKQNTWITNAIHCFVENNKPVKLNELQAVKNTTITWTAGFSDITIMIGNYHTCTYIFLR